MARIDDYDDVVDEYALTYSLLLIGKGGEIVRNPFYGKDVMITLDGDIVIIEDAPTFKKKKKGVREMEINVPGSNTLFGGIDFMAVRKAVQDE